MKFKLYLITLLIFLGIDAMWLGLVTSKFYRSQIGHLMSETPNLFAAGLFYLLFVGALAFFIGHQLPVEKRCGPSSCVGHYSGWSPMQPMT